MPKPIARYGSTNSANADLVQMCDFVVDKRAQAKL